MYILSAKQVPIADAYTVERENIQSVDLMKRAAQYAFSYILKTSTNNNQFIIFAGTGNNGGDGLFIAKFLAERNASVSVYIITSSHHESNDFSIAYKELSSLHDKKNLSINTIESFSIKNIPKTAIIIDAIFGTGLNRSISGVAADCIKFCNTLPHRKIAIDIPSGLFADIPTPHDTPVLRASETLTFNAPKFQFLFAENEQYTGTVHIFDIDLKTPFHEKELPYQFVSQKEISIRIKNRNQFSHKGTYGHALLIAGSYGKIGAAILASRSCLQTGCGLLTVHTPQCGYSIIQTAIPEAMVDVDNNDKVCSNIPSSITYKAIGIGPGIGTNELTKSALTTLFNTSKNPLVLDADALNILAQNDTLWEYVPENSIITPHPGEFDRLTQSHTNGYERFLSAIKFAQKHCCIVVLKEHYTKIILPSGAVFFNSTGNPYMATAGSGDVLTGMILSLLSQGYKPSDAAIVAVYLHGCAGDIMAKNSEGIWHPIIASDIIAGISKAYDFVHA